MKMVYIIVFLNYGPLYGKNYQYSSFLMILWIKIKNYKKVLTRCQNESIIILTLCQNTDKNVNKSRN